MKTILHFVALMTFCITAISVSAQNDSKNSINYADQLLASTNVTNPGNAVDNNVNTYAVLRADLGILNYSSITVGFSTYGIAGNNVNLEIQNDKDILSAEVLSSISVSVYDSHGKQVAARNGYTVADAILIEGTSRYRISIHVKDGAYDIASVKMSISGLLTIANSIRLYDVYTMISCPPIKGDILYSEQNVANAQNAVSPSNKDYALLTPPLLAGISTLDIAFSQPGTAGLPVAFNLGEGNILLSADLLQHITLSAFDNSGNVVATKSGFSVADAQVLPNGIFTLRIKTPKGNYAVSRGRITLTTIANVLTNLKVYNIVAHQQCTSNNFETQSTSDAVTSYNIQIVPNPFSAYTTLNIKGKLDNTSYITISDKTGNVIEQHQVNNVSSIRLLEKAPAGIYFIKISSANTVETRKVIKM